MARRFKHIETQRLIDAVESNTFGMTNIGFCVACGAEREGCEPDAREYHCEECGEDKVYGAEELLMHIA